MSPAAQDLTTTASSAATTEPQTGTLDRLVEGLVQPTPETSAFPSWWQLIVAFGFIVVGFIGRRVVMYLLTRYAQPTKGKEQRLDERLAEAAVHPAGFAVAMVGVLGAVKVLLLSVPTTLEWLDTFATNLAISIFMVDAAWLAFALINVLAEQIERVAKRTESRLDEQLVPIVRKALKVFVVIIATLQVVSQMGGDVKGLLAGITLGGLAFSLAAKDSIANIFGSVVILSDRPFRVGDWIEANGVEGTVEEIGFRSTRIRTFAKSLVTVPNSVVANWAINNWSAMPLRRVKMTIGVSYEATPRQMEAAVEGIRTILRNHAQVHQDFFLVYFNEFGASALEIFLYYFTITTVWAEYLQVRQEVNLAIMRLLQELGLQIAYPTRTVYMRRSKPPALPPQFREPDD